MSDLCEDAALYMSEVYPTLIDSSQKNKKPENNYSKTLMNIIYLFFFWVIGRILL
jgi:hypothetical protein